MEIFSSKRFEMINQEFRTQEKCQVLSDFAFCCRRLRGSELWSYEQLRLLSALTRRNSIHFVARGQSKTALKAVIKIIVEKWNKIKELTSNRVAIKGIQSNLLSSSWSRYEVRQFSSIICTAGSFDGIAKLINKVIIECKNASRFSNFIHPCVSVSNSRKYVKMSIRY